MNEKAKEKAIELFQSSKIHERETPDEYDIVCGSCTGDPTYNNFYTTTCQKAGEFVYVDNSCQNYILRNDEKINFAKMTYTELRMILEKIKKAIVEEEKKQENEKKKLEEILK